MDATCASRPGLADVMTGGAVAQAVGMKTRQALLVSYRPCSLDENSNERSIQIMCYRPGIVQEFDNTNCLCKERTGRGRVGQEE